MKSRRKYWENRYRNQNSITSASVIDDPKPVNERAKQKFSEIVISTINNLSIDLETASVLAAGCGTGAVSEVLASHSRSLYGFDFSQKAIQEIRAQGDVGEYVIGSVSDIPFRKHFDIVTAFSVLYHIIETHDWKSAIQELAHVTKNNGYLLIRINWSDESLGEQSSDSHFYDRSCHEYQKEFSKNKLTIVDIIDLPVKPIIFDKLPVFPGSRILKSVLAPVIVSADLFKSHKNKLIVLRKEDGSSESSPET